MSGPRLVGLTPDRLDDAQRAVYNAVAGGPRAQGPQLFRLVDDEGRLQGPFDAFLRQPELGLALQELGSAIRYRTALSARAREIAILVVAAHWDSAFERHAHEAVGRHVGLTEDELAALRTGTHDALTDPVDGLVARTAAALTGIGDLSDEAYAVAVAALGETGVFELTTLVGYYATLALQLRVFRVGVQDGAPGPQDP